MPARGAGRHAELVIASGRTVAAAVSAPVSRAGDYRHLGAAQVAASDSAIAVIGGSRCGRFLPPARRSGRAFCA